MKYINQVIPVDLVIDHSIQVDYYGTSYARTLNEKGILRMNRHYRKTEEEESVMPSAPKL